MKDSAAAAGSSILVAVASGSEDLWDTLLERLEAVRPGLPLYVISEFPPSRGTWIPYHIRRNLRDNLALCRSVLAGKRVYLCGAIFQPRMPYWKMRLLGFLLAPLRFAAFNENLDHFRLHPRSLPLMVRHVLWRGGNWVRWEFRPGGGIYTFLWRLAHPRAFLRPLHYRAALLAGALAAWWRSEPGVAPISTPAARLPAGISVVIPSRNGRVLLEQMLPGLEQELAGVDHEIIVVDNGSNDGTADFLLRRGGRIRVDRSERPLSFAEGVNRGIRQARFAHCLLLNNDMFVQEGFCQPLLDAFQAVPNLFCATAQIFFPPGERRQETGKAVLPAERAPEQFPIRCDEPLPDEDLTWVLYGSGGCSLYSLARLRELGGLRERFQPAYVEDLDLGYRAWLRGWPSVLAARARVVHRHRTTTARYFQPDELDLMVERNYLRFVAGTPASPVVFTRLWRDALRRLNHLAARQEPVRSAQRALAEAPRIALGWRGHDGTTAIPETEFLALTSGEVAVFPGTRHQDRPVVLIASPYAPFPLSHGGAVRMFNLMQRAARDYQQILVCFAEAGQAPAPELLAICEAVVFVRRKGSHAYPSSPRPDVVEEFDTPAFHAAIRQVVRQWKPALVQLEFTQMAQYAEDCSPARTILVEHDITLDLYGQLVRESGDWETRFQLQRWVTFETQAWSRVDCVVTMSEKDRVSVTGARRAVALPNGVDLVRFQPSGTTPEPSRILFIGSFAHLPNVMAVDFFLREVWDRLRAMRPVLHIVAGPRHRYYLHHYRDRVRLDLDQERIEVEDFVADVRPAYERASVVVAPLVASAGTNIKIMEAMAMSKAIVTTPAGVNGLDVRDGVDVLIAESGQQMADQIRRVLQDGELRARLGAQARKTAQERYDWEVIAELQRRLYESLR